MSWKDKVVIVTGSSIGIGRKMVEQLLAQEAKVVMNARNAERLNASVESLQGKEYQQRLIGIPGDVSSQEDCAQLINQTVEAFGQLDVLINNAGISTEGDVAEVSNDIYKKVMDVNFMGSVYPTQYALPHLRKTEGSVLFVSSVAGIRGIPGYSAYSASKMALTALAESLKVEEEKHGIHVGIAYVGFTENDPQKSIYDKNGKVIAQPSRDFIKQEPVEKVAARLIGMVEKRRFKQVFTTLGKLNAGVNRLFPGVVERILKNAYNNKSEE